MKLVWISPASPVDHGALAASLGSDFQLAAATTPFPTTDTEVAVVSAFERDLLQWMANNLPVTTVIIVAAPPGSEALSADLLERGVQLVELHSLDDLVAAIRATAIVAPTDTTQTVPVSDATIPVDPAAADPTAVFAAAPEAAVGAPAAVSAASRWQQRRYRVGAVVAAVLVLCVFTGTGYAAGRHDGDRRGRLVVNSKIDRAFPGAGRFGGSGNGAFGGSSNSGSSGGLSGGTSGTAGGGTSSSDGSQNFLQCLANSGALGGQSGSTTNRQEAIKQCMQSANSGSGVQPLQNGTTSTTAVTVPPTA